jgi:cytochrome oxidase Cu insertion factor (SCO1/SenC/PrrC family)
MRPRSWIGPFAALGIFLLVPARMSGQAGKTAAPAGDRHVAAQRYFTDTILTDQNGRNLRFYSDLVKDHVVVISTFFVDCTNVCSPLNYKIEKIQEALGSHLGSQVRLLSITVDPVRDTSTRLAEYAGRFHARPGWSFLTGRKENVDLVLKKLGQYVESRDDHLNLILIGNDSTGLWKKAFGLARTEDLIKVVDSVLQDK